MGTLKNDIKYRCFNDCKQSGCPSHVMSLTIQTTSDVLMVYKDGEYWFGADPSEWNALKTMLQENDYVFFDLKSDKREGEQNNES